VTEDPEIVTSHHGKVLRPGLVAETELQLHGSLDLAGIADLVLDVTVPDFADAGAVFVLEHPVSGGETGGTGGGVVARRLGTRLALVSQAVMREAFPAGERPDRGRSASPARPSALNRPIQRRTVAGWQSSSSAIWAGANPCSDSRTITARLASRHRPCRSPRSLSISLPGPLANTLTGRILTTTSPGGWTLDATSIQPPARLMSTPCTLRSHSGLRAELMDRRLAVEAPEKRQAAAAELAELEARQRLATDLEMFVAWRDRLGVIAALDKAHSALATNRITSAQRDLTESEIGKALGAALADELTMLSCTHVPVELSTRTQVAETRAGLRLLAQQPAGLSDIVSEGERRALALCFFFAELSTSNDVSGIIVDDPVSSLDDERRDYIARRLVAEAHRRQVIIFTHDLPFVFDIRCQAKKAGVSLCFQHIWRLGDHVGRVDGYPPFKTMSLRERIGKLEQELLQAKEEAKPADYEQAWRRANGFYHRVRTSWERAVEERLFAGVVERFERDVKTLQLKDVKITDELIGEVERGMTRASMFLHEDAFAAQVSLPSLAEMSKDLDALRQFERATRRTNS
jgi:AAA domain